MKPYIVTKPDGTRFEADRIEQDFLGRWAVIDIPGSVNGRRIKIQDGWRVGKVNWEASK